MNSLKNMVAIDVEMIPAKITFFLTDGYYGATAPFMNVFFVSLGLSATQAGFISGVSLLVSSVFNPLWSTLADATGHRKLIFIIMCIGTALSVFSIPWVELTVGHSKIITNCTQYNKTHNYTYTTEGCEEKQTLTNTNTVFYTLLCLNVFAWIFYTSVRCYVDGLVTNVVNTGSVKRTYGKQRVFSSLGYALINFLTGVICDHYHPKGMSQYTAIFYVFLPCIILVTPWGCKLISMAKWDSDDNKEENSTESNKKGGNVGRQLLKVFSNIDFAVFFLSIIVSGLTLNIFNCFFFLLMEQELKSKKTVMTFAIVVSVVCEVTIFAFSKKFIKLCGGEIASFTIGIFSFFPRFMVMAYASNPWHAIAVQPLHGLGMGLSWAAAIEYASKAFPAEIRVTGIALMSSIEFIASNAVSNMVGGILYDTYGGRVLFKGSGVFAAVWCLFMAIYYGMRSQKKKSLEKYDGPTNIKGVVNPIGHAELMEQAV